MAVDIISSPGLHFVDTVLSLVPQWVEMTQNAAIAIAYIVVKNSSSKYNLLRYLHYWFSNFNFLQELCGFCNFACVCMFCEMFLVPHGHKWKFWHMSATQILFAGHQKAPQNDPFPPRPILPLTTLPLFGPIRPFLAPIWAPFATFWLPFGPFWASFWPPFLPLLACFWPLLIQLFLLTVCMDVNLTVNSFQLSKEVPLAFYN